jgi:hypothetical protein
MASLTARQLEGLEHGLQFRHEAIAEAQREFNRFIVHCHDTHKLTFRQIEAMTGIAGSWILKLYRRGRADNGDEPMIFDLTQERGKDGNISQDTA